MRYTRETKVGIFVLAALAIFIFMGYQIGTFRFDRHKYVPYRLYFEDLAGLLPKAEVKIAGVKVGWVDQIALTHKHNMCAGVEIMIDKKFCLYQNAYGIVRQEGLLGPVYLELIPGNAILPKLSPGAELAQSTEPACMDEVMRGFKDVAHDIQEIVGSFKQIFASAEGMHEMKEIVSSVKSITKQLQRDVLPSFQESISRIAYVCDRDFSNFADRVASTAHMMEDASEHMKNSFQAVNEIATKVNEGEGFVGKLIQDDQIYKDIQNVTGKVSDSFNRFSDLYFTYDGHVENMFERASFSCFKNAKGIFNVRIYPRSDYFYLVGVTTSQQGYIKRTLTLRDFTDDCLNEICPEDCDLPDWAKFKFIFNKNKQQVKRNAFKVNLQFGKIYKNIALRAGLFEGTGGVAVDLFAPYKERHGLISTFKIYDFRGQNRIDDERPHLKWINRIFLFRKVYLAFGFDDFVSRCNKSIFLGAGFRFGDEDLKWFLPNYVGT